MHEFFFTLKLRPGRVFNRHVLAINHAVIVSLSKLTALTPGKGGGGALLYWVTRGMCGQNG